MGVEAMTTIEKTHALDLSRRKLLRGAVVVAGGGALLAAGFVSASAKAPDKMSQSAANYQTTPKGGARCNVCSQWLAPTDCKVVQGPVSPTGWCSLYIPKW